MAIPDYQTIMSPVLRRLTDGRERVTSDLTPDLADEFGLTEGERAELLPSGKQPVFANRVGWATTYLAKAGLIERTGRKRVRITERGLQALRDVDGNGGRVDAAYLKRFPEFLEFAQASRPRENPGARSKPQGGRGPEEKVVSSAERHQFDLPPNEALAASYHALRAALGQELLEHAKRASPAFFERLVIDLLVAMGYGGSLEDAARAVGGSGDDGVDGIIKEDRLGLDFVYVQAKRWGAPVGRPIVQAFAGSLEGQRARKGVLITTSKFTREAEEYVTRIEKRIVLIDGTQLADLMIEHGVGVADVATYRVQRVDADYFGET